MLKALQITTGFAWLIWFTSGTAGLESGLEVGALLVFGLGARNLLDTFWKKEEMTARRAEFKFEKPSLISLGKKMSLPSPNWSLPAQVRAGVHQSAGMRQ